MSAGTEVSDYPFNWLRWLVVIALVVAGVWGNAFYSETALLYRVITLMVLALGAFWVAINTAQGAVMWSVVKESQTEVRKVVWPSRQETGQTALIVIVLTVFMALILWALDAIFGWIVSLIIG